MSIKNIYIIGEINDELAADVSRQITEAKNAEVTKIIFKINSGGGSVIAGLSMYDEISALECETEAVILGMCASSATYPALACDRISMMQNGSFMIHRARGGVQGTMEEMERDLEFLEEVENRFIAIYCAKYARFENWGQPKTVQALFQSRMNTENPSDVSIEGFGSSPLSGYSTMPDIMPDFNNNEPSF